MQEDLHDLGNRLLESLEEEPAGGGSGRPSPIPEPGPSEPEVKP
jgi:hypothetical protein